MDVPCKLNSVVYVYHCHVFHVSYMYNLYIIMLNVLCISRKIHVVFCFSFCFSPSVCLLPRFLPLRATRRPKSDTNGFSATLA